MRWYNFFSGERTLAPKIFFFINLVSYAFSTMDLPTVTLQITPSEKITVGDTFSLQGNVFGIPAIPNSLLEIKNIDQQNIDFPAIGLVLKSAQFIAPTQIHLVFIATKPQPVQLESLLFSLSGKKAFARSHPLTLQITSPLSAEEQQPEGFSAPLPIEKPAWVKRTEQIALIFLVVVLTILGIWLTKQWLSNRKRKKKLPYDLQALKTIEDIFMQEPDLKKVYFVASETLKTYMSQRFLFFATGLTSQEILQHLEHTPQTFIEKIADILENLDHVKFMDITPDKKDAWDLKVKIIEWIEQTRISEVKK